LICARELGYPVLTMERDEIEEREPCPDDLCTGVIGESGRCGVCGKERVGAPPARRAPRPGEEAAPAAPVAEEGEESLPGRDDAGGGGPAGPEDRVPCADDLCTGIIGADGRCGVCGKRPA